MDINRTHELERLSQTIMSIRNIQSDAVSNLDQLGEQLSKVVATGTDIVLEQQILGSLRFQSMRVRHSDIAVAHDNTFNWIFDPSHHSRTDLRSQIKFIEWLRQPHNQEGVYWVAGKAGSGKSTLMKFLCDHPRTFEALETWAWREKLVTASFFFWNSGTAMQKSQEGLFQSLLYEVLRKCPDLIPAVFPKQWDKYYEGSWTRSELVQAFRRLMNQDIASVKFCFFIDGLDEFEGDHREMVATLDGFASSSNVKVCISSRPWEVFKSAYDGNVDRRLYLQDLTRGDINFYVRQELQQSQHFVQALQGDSRYQDLVNEIIDKAQGVFLWVFLVVRSLIEGLSYADTIPVLQMRLRRLPSDLEQYFRHMLETVDDIYQEQRAQTFQVALSAVEPFSVMTYWFLDGLEENPQLALKAKIRTTDESEIYTSQRTIQKRLDARSKGLLEVSYEVSEPIMHQSTRAAVNTTEFFRYKVNFLHRTVRDFLASKDMQVMLSNQTRPRFSAHASLCPAFLAQIKTIPFPIVDKLDQFVFNQVEDLAYHARQAEIETSRPQMEVLDELDRTLQEFCRKGILVTEHLSVDSFLGFCTERGLKLYIGRKLDENQTLLSKYPPNKRPLLDHALHSRGTPKYRRVECLDTARVLLERGAGPNEYFAGYTVFTNFVHKLSIEYIGEDGLENMEFRKEAIDLLLRHHANPSETADGVSLLSGCLLKSTGPDLNTGRFFINVAESLLRHGADPDTVWKDYLGALCESLERERGERYNPETLYHQVTSPEQLRVTSLHFEATELLLSYGADPDAKCWNKLKHEHSTVPDIIELAFPARQAEHLLELHRQQRGEKGKRGQKEEHARKEKHASGILRWLGLA